MGFLKKLADSAVKAAEAAKATLDAAQAPAAPPPPAARPAPAVARAAVPEEPEAEEPADPEARDYALEEQDDAAGFDLEGDLAGWYVAEFRIEQAWDDEDERAQLFAEYGVRNPQHFHQVKATVDRFIQSPAAQARYGDIGDIMHVKMQATQAFMMQRMQAPMTGGAGGAPSADLQPFEGVSLEQWALQQVRAIGGATVDDICAALGCDAAKWDRVNAEWNARMSRDTTMTIATAYGNAFTKAQATPGVGNSPYAAAAQNPGKGPLPMPLERYVEAMEAQSALTAQGQDPQAVLQKLGLSVLDWANLGAWFSAYINENALRNDSAVLNEYNRLTEKYQAKYASVKSDADITF